MSGIIGGAGSKSGVIGETELDYEEGSWTPVPDAGSFNASNNRFRKIGGMCWLECYLNNIQDGFDSLGGIPFPTNPAGTAYENITGTIMANNIDVIANCYEVGSYIYNSRIYFYQSRDDAGWYDWRAANYDNNDDLYFSLSYMCQL